MPGLNIEVFVQGPFQENTCIVWCDETKEAIFVDPGGELYPLERFVEKHGLKPSAIVNTHGHVDHVAGVAELVKKYGIPFRIHKGDEQTVNAFKRSAAFFGLDVDEAPVIDSFIEDGEILRVGACELRVVHTPGHSPGGCCLLAPGLAIVGDTLFAGSVGRTDLPGGDWPTLLRSIREKLLVLPDDVRVVSGHGPDTSIGRERRVNPFIAE